MLGKLGVNMAGRHQTLSKGQKDEVVQILKKKLLFYVLTGGTIFVLITGLSLLSIMKRVENGMEKLVAKQFEEPRIKKLVRQVATERASTLMMEQITPEVNNFKKEVNNQLEKLYPLVAAIQELKVESQKSEQEIQTVLKGLEYSLKQSRSQLSTIKSDNVEMQKYVSIIQYYQIEGANRFPNPYIKEMLDALNKLVVIAIPNSVERNKFIAEIQVPQEPKK